MNKLRRAQEVINRALDAEAAIAIMKRARKERYSICVPLWDTKITGSHYLREALHSLNDEILTKAIEIAEADISAGLDELTEGSE